MQKVSHGDLVTSNALCHKLCYMSNIIHKCFNKRNQSYLLSPPRVSCYMVNTFCHNCFFYIAIALNICHRCFVTSLKHQIIISQLSSYTDNVTRKWVTAVLLTTVGKNHRGRGGGPRRKIIGGRCGLKGIIHRIGAMV